MAEDYNSIYFFLYPFCVIRYTSNLLTHSQSTTFLFCLYLMTVKKKKNPEDISHKFLSVKKEAKV